MELMMTLKVTQKKWPYPHFTLELRCGLFLNKTSILVFAESAIFRSI